MNQPTNEIERLDSLFSVYAEPVLQSCRGELECRKWANLTIALIPTCALHHIMGCLTASRSARRACSPAIAIGILRQSVEALSLVDMGLQEATFSESLLQEWAAGKRTNGAIRQVLEKHVWGRYGNGLWTESWTEFYASLARAVQPYAHYSFGLVQWQMAVPELSRNDGDRFSGVAAVHPYVSDPTKLARIALFELLMVWVIGRLVIANKSNCVSHDSTAAIAALGDHLRSSPLLFQLAGWETQFLPHVMFAP